LIERGRKPGSTPACTLHRDIIAITAALLLTFSAPAKVASAPDGQNANGTQPPQAKDVLQKITARLRVGNIALCNIALPPHTPRPGWEALTQDAQLPDYFSVAVEYESLPHVLHLTKYSVRGPDFQVLVQQPGGELVPTDPGPVRTYIGFIEGDPGSIVGAILSPNGLRAKVLRTKGPAWAIEPLEDAERSELPQAAATASGKTHAVFCECDVETPDLFFNHPPLPPPNPGEPPLASFGPLQAAGVSAASTAIGANLTASFAWYGCDVMRAQIGFDVDYEFYSAYAASSQATVLVLLEGLVNNEFNTRFVRDTLIEHVIGKVIIRTDKATDPYADTPDMGTQLTTLRNIWNALPSQEQTHDLAQLETGQTTNYGGLAWVTVVCSSYRYSVATRAFGEAFWGGAARHEIAHNWSLGHSHRACPEKNIGIMCGDSSRMHVLEVDSIIGHRNSRTCLANIGPYPFPVAPYAAMDQLYTTVGGPPAPIDVLANDHDANCDELAISNFDTVSELGGTVVRSYGTGPGGRDRLLYTPPADAYGIDWFTYTLDDGAGQQGAGNVKAIVKLPNLTQGCWKLDETAGSTAHDSSGNGYNASLEGTFIFDTASTTGRFGRALEFNGADDHVRIPALLLNSNTVTITAWINRDGDQADWSGIVFCRDESTVAGLNLGTNNELRYHWNGDNYSWNSGLAVPDAQWTFVALVIRPNSAYVYMTGSRGLVSAGRAASHYIEMFDGWTRIGSDASGSRYFRGQIDDVRIYNYALETADIQTISSGGRAENPTPFNGNPNAPQRATLKWNPGATAVYHDVYFGLDHDAVANAATSSPEYKGRQGYASYLPFMETDTQYFWRIDQVIAGPSVITGSLWSFTTGSRPGTITRAVWTNIAGDSVASLTGNPSFPNRPNSLEEITFFEAPANWANNYGTLVHGFLTPPLTGSYTFRIAGDDNCELWLSTSVNPASQTRIARVPGWTDPRQWDKYAEQESAPIALTADKPYYIKALHKEAAGDDHLAVAWAGPWPSPRIISGAYLAPYDASPPVPNTMTWAAPPHPVTARSISMTATTALDRGGVEYYFTCTSGAGHNSGWQQDPAYIDTNLTPNTLYTYTVTARDKSLYQNSGIPSLPASAKTPLAGDTEPDNDVDFADFARFSQHFPNPGPLTPQAAAQGDLDGDGDVDMQDASVIADNWLAAP